MLQSWWNKVVEKIEADKDEEGSKLGIEQVEEDDFSEKQSKTTARISRPVDDLISLDAFCEIMVRSKHRWMKTQNSRIIRGHLQMVFSTRVQLCGQRLSNGLRHRYFDWLIGGAVILNTVIIIVELTSMHRFSGGKATLASFCADPEQCLWLLVCFEMLFKIMILGISTYWMRLQHRFDALTAMLVIVGQIAIRTAVAHNISLCEVIQYVCFFA